MENDELKTLADEVLRQETALAEGRAVDVGGQLYPALQADDGRRRLGRAGGCPDAREWELMRRAQAMDFALTHVRLVVQSEMRNGMVPAEMVLQALSEPCRFPLPGDTEALEAYRKAYGHGNRAILHIAGCDVCEPAGCDGPEFCQRYSAAAEADAREALRARGRH